MAKPRNAKTPASRIKGEVLCFGETLGLVLNPRGTRLRECATAQVSFAGAESNVAIGLARLGCRVSWLSAVGVDPVGDRILRQLRAEGVGVDRVQVDPARPTAMMLRDRVTWTEPSVYYWRNTSAFNGAVGDLGGGCDWSGVGALLLSGITPALGEKAFAATKSMVNAARRRNIPVWFDINHRRKLWSEETARARLTPLLKSFDILFTSEDEGRILTGHRDPEAIGRALLDKGARMVVLKLGVRGVYAFDAKGKVFCPPFKIETEVDPIGAGDGFDAGFLSGVMEGRPTKECLLRGSACGAMVCLTDGDWEGLPTPAEIERFVQQERKADR
ncbi:MAG TPA: sugar kinase [Vicinamibacterales bacterium]|nr:sugar kinase [Vicinamibacterales bacterium]